MTLSNKLLCVKKYTQEFTELMEAINGYIDEIMPCCTDKWKEKNIQKNSSNKSISKTRTNI